MRETQHRPRASLARLGAVPWIGITPPSSSSASRSAAANAVSPSTRSGPPASPVVGEKRALNDRLSPKAHRIRCGRNGVLVEFNARDRFDLEALRAEVVDIALFVTKSSLTRHIEERIPRLSVSLGLADHVEEPNDGLRTTLQQGTAGQQALKLPWDMRIGFRVDRI